MKKRALSCMLSAAMAASVFSSIPATVSAKIDFDNLPTPISADDDSKEVKDFISAKTTLKIAYKYDYSNSEAVYASLEWTPVKNALMYRVLARKPRDKEYTVIATVCSTEYYATAETPMYFCVQPVTFNYDDEIVEGKKSNRIRLAPSVNKKNNDLVVDAAEGIDGEGSVIEECEEAVYEEIDADMGVALPSPTMPEVNTEEYSHSEESGFKSAAADPLSTFSADVDTAAYANIRRILSDGGNIPEDAVRIEEMLNYFDYNYVQPKGSSPFSVTYELSDCPWNDKAKLLMLGIQGKDIPAKDTPASNLVFLVDVSGSMYSPDKLPLVVEAINMMAQTMSSEDRISIVTYSGEENIVLAGAKGNQVNTVKAMTASLEAGGSTNGEGGINAAYDIAEHYFIEGGNNRIIIATDGDLNVGISSESELKELIEEKRETGVYFTALGFGDGNLKDNKLETLADNGNGSYHYIDTGAEAAKVLVEERNSTLYTIAGDVKMQLEFNPQNVKSYRLIGYDNRRLNNEDFTDDTKDAGEVGAGHSVTVMYEIIPADGKADASLKYQQPTGKNKDEWCTLKVRYKKPGESKSKQISTVIKGSAYSPAEEMSDRMKFACAVTQFGLLLKDSEYKGNASIESIEALMADGFKNIGYSDSLAELVKLYKKYYKD